MNAPRASKDIAAGHKTGSRSCGKAFLWMLLAPMLLLSTNALAEACFANAVPQELTVELDQGPSQTNRHPFSTHPWRKDLRRGNRYHFTPNIPELLKVLSSVDNHWETPSNVWPENAITVNMIENNKTVCRITYSRDELYAQNKQADGFLVRKLYEFEAQSINDALFNVVIYLN